MAGNIEGGRKAAQTNLKKDPDFFKKIGRKGGSAEHKTPRGFAVDDRTVWDKMLGRPKRAQLAGRRGGLVSKEKRKALS